jgi:hypothetical protein
VDKENNEPAIFDGDSKGAIVKKCQTVENYIIEIYEDGLIL